VVNFYSFFNELVFKSQYFPQNFKVSRKELDGSPCGSEAMLKLGSNFLARVGVNALYVVL